ncbi:hypothetical protein HBA55_35050 [Pseudomaricurvus alkylphenolicus]|uniref:hypothetical protein n=1 Tax=Pseudomaricurvus alkylphenolicus TaxID=1306991 RepID=UPI0014213792|nr:hypothetical protein [Pseudomaricurvus alkylphenolicus]NIB44852.1 hypothetical protein [Pseudomaricurvus alkylphenolicus]
MTQEEAKRELELLREMAIEATKDLGGIEDQDHSAFQEVATPKLIIEIADALL